MSKVALLAFGVFLPIVTAQMDAQKAIIQLSFLAMDSNKDGRISTGEYRDSIVAYDSDKNGYLTLDEYAKNSHYPLDIAGVLFNHFDKDHSKTVDVNGEITAAFREYDTDDDHFISDPEFFHERTILFKLVSDGITGGNPVG